MKLLTFAVPCYNSQDYMEHCIHTLLEGGDEVEIILVDDGSRDNTGAIADRYAQQYPDIVRVIHQENGGHGEGVNQGLRHAQGLYYKVVDSDDWADVDALRQVVDKLREFSQMPEPVDLLVCNYVYEHVEDHTQKVMRYTNVFPQGRVFTWDEIDRFRPSQYLLMHSVFYRTQLLRGCGLELPKHTFYVDNIFVYQPLPYVKTLYYMNLDFYRYFIGRADQSVNEQVMVKRVDQQLRVTRIMIGSHDLTQISAQHRRLGPGDDDDHLLHLPHHRRFPRSPGEKDRAVGISAHGLPPAVPPDEVSLLLHRQQLSRLSGPEAVGIPVPAGPEDLQVQLTGGRAGPARPFSCHVGGDKMPHRERPPASLHKF